MLMRALVTIRGIEEYTPGQLFEVEDKREIDRLVRLRAAIEHRMEIPLDSPVLPPPSMEVDPQPPEKIDVQGGAQDRKNEDSNQDRKNEHKKKAR